MFDPNDCIVVIQTYPDGQAQTDIWGCLYAKGIPMENVNFVNMRDVIVARNFAVQHYILPSGKNTALLLDNDVRPGLAGTERFWDADGDIVGAYAPMGSLALHINGAVHCGMMRVNTDIFKALSPPWFDFVRTPDGCGTIECECSYFTQRARAAGYSVVQAGYCGHGEHAY